MRAWATGFGTVQFSDFKVTVYGSEYRPRQAVKNRKIGYVVPIMPHYNLKENFQVFHYIEGPNFKTQPGEYQWSASGNIKLIPLHYKMGGSVGGGPGGNFAWTEDTSQPATKYDGSGSWVVEHREFKYGAVDNRLTGRYRCAGCSEKVSTQYKHRISCANPHDDNKYYSCLQTEKWQHLYEETCSDANCADTGVFRCTHTHSDPPPPPPDVDPPDIAGSCGHTFPTAQIASHEPSRGSCGHFYSPCTPGNHSWITPLCNVSAHANYECLIGSSHSMSIPCPTDDNGQVCDYTSYYECSPHTHVYPTLTITYSCGIHSGPTGSASSDHSTTMSGWSGTFYECQPHTTYPCGHTDPTANAAYHTPRSGCTQTNSNGQSCTVTNFYDCGQHTHVYPAPTISCGRSGCSQTVSSSTEHSATCASGHSYWTCKPTDVSLHITRTCRLSTCGKSWERCSTVGWTPLCDDPWRRSNGLPCWKR